MATTTDIDPQNFNADGVVGLGFSAVSQIPGYSESILGNLIEENSLNREPGVVGFYLADQPGPELIVGGTDSTKFSGSLTYFFLNSLVSI